MAEFTKIMKSASVNLTLMVLLHGKHAAAKIQIFRGKQIIGSFQASESSDRNLIFFLRQLDDQ